MGIFDPFGNLKEAFNRADRGGEHSAGYWLDYLNGKDFLIFLGIIALAVVTVPMFLSQMARNAEIALCTHESYAIDDAYFNDNNKVMSVKCESCEKNFTFTPNIEVTSYEATCTYEGKFMEWWTFEEFPGLSHSYVKTYPKIPHVMGKITIPGTPATCTWSGITDTGHCAMCNGLIGGETLPILGHDYQLQGYVAPTCSSTGWSGVEICLRCNKTNGSMTVLPRSAHTETSGTFAATYNICGFTGTACVDCGFPISIDEVHSPALIAEYFEYEPTADGAGLIITAVKKTEEHMEIPNYIDGNAVLYLGEGLFKNNEILEGITLPEGLLEIGSEAFLGCTSLRGIILPNSATYVGADAFRGCAGLLSVDLGSGVSRVEENAFLECSNLLSFRFPENYNLQENYISFSRTIPVVYNPKVTVYYFYMDWQNRGEYRSYAPDSIYAHKYNDTEQLIYEEDGYFFYNDGSHKVLVHCKQEKARDGVLFVPDGTNVLCDGLLYRVKEVEGMVLPRSVYHIMEQTRYKSEWIDYSDNPLNVYYYGTDDELYFIENGGITGTAGEPILMGSYYGFDFYCKRNGDYEWEFDENGLPKIKEYQ